VKGRATSGKTGSTIPTITSPDAHGRAPEHFSRTFRLQQDENADFVLLM
jgi:hypothetical protein